jgi:isopentenyl-diphosphate delta-isomerase
MEQEQIVFVDKEGKPTGEAGPKLASHTANTKLHLAFSCYIFRADTGKFLFTKRAHSKKVWPDVWTNSVCGHPMPGEGIEDAIRRRSAYEVGIHRFTELHLAVPRYIYMTPPYNGIVEHEFCPIYLAVTRDEPQPNPAEVEAYRWITWTDYRAALHDDAEHISYWAKDQYSLVKSRVDELLAKLI